MAGHPDDDAAPARTDGAMANRKPTGDPAAPPAAATETLGDLQRIEADARAAQTKRESELRPNEEDPAHDR